MTRRARDAVIAVDSATSEQRFAAGMIVDALQRASEGDLIARSWLRRAALSWVAWITPPDLDPATVHARILAVADQDAAPIQPTQLGLWAVDAAESREDRRSQPPTSDPMIDPCRTAQAILASQPDEGTNR